LLLVIAREKVLQIGQLINVLAMRSILMLSFAIGIVQSTRAFFA
jgi:hypothetical protein